MHHIEAFDHVPPQHRAFAARVRDAALLDPHPTFAALSAETGIPVEELVHFALVRWTSAGSEALLAIRPPVLDDLFAAREREDWRAVAGIVDGLRAGFDEQDAATE